MGKFNMWLQRLMYGRYGSDDLNKFLVAVTFVCIILNVFVRGYPLRLLTVILLILIYCRMFSRNYAARARENDKFLEILGKRKKNGHHASYSSGTGYGYRPNTGYSGPRPAATRASKDKDHRILRCPACGGKLRVPKGLGKISITCPHCSQKFEKKV